MDLNVISEFVNSIGFPAAVCAGLFWLNRETAKQYQDILKEFKVTIDNNTKALNELLKNIGD